MYQFAVSFTVPAEHREDFIAAALEDARGSLADEPGCLRFEVVADSEDPSLIHLVEAYRDKAAVDDHVAGEHFQRFIKAVSAYAEGPVSRFTGTRVEASAQS
ncbi:putative quinol monooxygenase [Glycomyces paridis]|uniref:Antibiotic biosynthesis monooxygenase n=1 Tax=Glycomyces paridis TaxID=2126555 RepID=A0A4S8NYW4_9ACTN|nr:putative quinol monooxygenase [Glycomyces paridis]THV22880.1 antibiotic biosynthesis monooxygenase [Glycomyces paridis]